MTRTILTLQDLTERRRRKSALQAALQQERRAVLVVNTRSRRGERSYATAKRLLKEAGVRIEAAYPVRNAERLPDIVRSEIEKGRSLIIVGGGDGTVSSVVDDFAYRDVAFGLLPLGTANSFARTLGIPLDLAGAVEVIARGNVADIDLGAINGDYFANGAAIGLPSAIARATPHGLKRWPGRAAYPIVALNKLARLPAFECTVTVGDQSRTQRTLDIAIAISGYQGGALIAPDANVDDGRVVVQILKGVSAVPPALGQDRPRTPTVARRCRYLPGGFADDRLRSAAGRVHRWGGRCTHADRCRCGPRSAFGDGAIRPHGDGRDACAPFRT